MKIAQVMAGARSGGAELFFERLCAALHRRGDAILPVIRRDPGRAERLRRDGLEPAQLRFGGPLDLLTRPRLGRLLRAFEPRVVVSWMSRAAHATPEGDWVHVGRLGGYYDLRYFRGCRHLVGNTRGVVDWIRAQGFPRERTHLLPNFVPDLIGAAPAALPDGPTILALGRLHPNKAFDILIRAVPSLPGTSLVIAGEGPERPALERLAAELGVAERVHLIGWRSDQAALLAACDVLVCPSRVEALGNVVLEAFSAAKPVVAAAVGGPLEMIDPGRTGLLVPPEDPARLAAAIRAVLEDGLLAADLGRGGRAEWERRHAEPTIVAHWRHALDTMASG